MDNVKVGGLALSHPQFTRRDSATVDLNKRLNENEDVITPIQLAPTTIWNNTGNKISSKVLAVECAKEHAQIVKHRLFTKLLNVPESMKFSNTRYFKYIPFSATGTITDKVRRAGIYLQNKYLIQMAAITVVNINYLNWVVPNTTDTFEALVLNVNIPDTTSKVFTSVEMGMMDNKAHLLTTKSVLTVATTWIDAFIMTMNDAREGEAFWKDRTGFPNPPERIDRPVSSDAQVAYANYLEQSIMPLIGEGYEDSGAKQAPTRRSYRRVVYGEGKHTKSTNTNGPGSMGTKTTEVSSISSMSTVINDNLSFKKTMKEAVNNMQREAKKGQQDMRQSLLEEMKQIRQEHSTRASKIEESVEVFDHMLRELHASNKEKSGEMAKYERRLGQLGAATANVASKVEDLSTTMHEKVDKLHLTMKVFMNGMSDTVNGKNKDGEFDERQKRNLKELSRLLEEDVSNSEEQRMDLDDEVSCNYNTQTPTPGTMKALSGVGNKK